jgi:quinol monooxygenase YgiN
MRLAIKVIVELQAQPGRRDELKGLLGSMVANHRPSQRGFLGSARYEVLDNPDMLIEIAEWESAEARVAHMKESAATGVYNSILEMLAVPFRATVIRQLCPDGTPALRGRSHLTAAGRSVSQASTT